MDGDGVYGPIIIEDCAVVVEDDAPPSKRLCPGISSALELSKPSQDAQLALSLQLTEFGCTYEELEDQLDVVAARQFGTSQAFHFTELPRMEEQGNQVDVGSPKTSANGLLKRSNGKGFSPKLVDVKLYVTDKKSILVHINPNAQLVAIFSDARVDKVLRGCVGSRSTCVTNFADFFNLHRSLPKPCVFDRSLAERTSVLDAVGHHGGVLRVHAKRSFSEMSILVPNGGSTDQKAGCVAAVEAVAGECDRVEVLRLRTPDGLLGSPVVLIKNFNRDRGVLLARQTGLKEMVEMAPEARAAINDNVRNELDSYSKAKRNFTDEVRRASDRVLQLGEEAVKDDILAKPALAHHTEYASTMVLLYDKNVTLPRHVDGCGHWVILFSFGLTVDFFAGERRFPFESGDALIFNGSKRHHVTHGIDRVHSKASLQGKPKPLPKELSYVSKIRASFQARQGDP